MLTGCRWHKAEYVFLPDGFVGWVRIDYSARDSPPLTEIDGHFVVEVAGEARIRTSNPMLTGIANDRYFYRNGSMTQPLAIASPDSSPEGMVRGLHYVVSEKTDHRDEEHFRTFFVGDLPAFNKARNAEPSVDHR
jgi:hypothetical protein